WVATSRSEDAGGAATSDGASARGGAGMNEEGRGFSPFVNHVATATPVDVTRVRGRRARFFSRTGFGGGGAAAVGRPLWCGTTAGFAAGFATGLPFAATRATGFGGLTAFGGAGFAAFFAARFGAALGLDGRRIAFLTGRLRARAAAFFP